MIEPLGGFVEIWISTPLSTCEARDRKGLYAKARKGLLKGMTGIDDPYEAPETPELNIDTTDVSIEEAVRIVTEYLQQKGFIPKNEATLQTRARPSNHISLAYLFNAKVLPSFFFFLLPRSLSPPLSSFVLLCQSPSPTLRNQQTFSTAGALLAGTPNPSTGFP
eukprot:04286_4